MIKERFSQAAKDYQRVEQAIRYLEANFQNQPGLEEIATSVHLSPYHFQRLFQRWAGISPSRFLQFLTLEYAKERLRASQSVLDAALDAGLSGPGRLHDLFVTFEALTPGEYKQQGSGLEIAYGFHDTPFGRCLLATTHRGICGVRFLEGGAEDSSLAQIGAEWPRARFVEDAGGTQALVERIFAPAQRGQERPFHLLLKGTNFQVSVWRALLAIPAGDVVSFEALSGSLGRPRSTRAVANAIARNPVAYLVPCHRVIRKAGETARYRWGAARKKAMLAWEAGRLEDLPLD